MLDKAKDLRTRSLALPVCLDSTVTFTLVCHIVGIHKILKHTDLPTFTTPT